MLGVDEVSRIWATAFAVAAASFLLAASTGAIAAGGPAREVFGRSVEGRPLVDLRRGPDGDPDRILVFGCIHGDETAGMRVARLLLRGRAPRQAGLWIVPTLNPDGVAAGTRGNAHHVDLNRNFPTGWRPLAGLEYSGPHPLSEPESRAAVRLIRRLRPDITIWFHQPWGLVDRSPGPGTVERRFAALSGLPLVRLRRYPGSVSRWQDRTLPGSAFVVELPGVVGGRLVRRAARAVLALAAEYGSGGISGATPVAEAPRPRATNRVPS